MLELAEKVLAITGSKSKLVYKPLPGDDPKQRKPDITLAGELFGWKPEIGLEEGLLYTITYFKQNFERIVSRKVVSVKAHFYDG